MISLARSDKSLVARWWWTVDRSMLAMVFVMCLTGLMLTLTASPAVADRIGYADSMHFAKRQFFFMGLAMATVLIVSMVPRKLIHRFALPGLLAALILLVLTLFVGTETKGAQRWLTIAGFGLQPSEFLKPLLAVSAAFLLSAKFEDESSPAFLATGFVFLLCAAPLLMQPDVGQTFLIALMLLGQMTLAGLPVLWIMVSGAAGLGGLGIAYLTLPHVAGRIDRFLDPGSGDNYQVEKAREAFESGGLFGTGPGEGTVKVNLPDAHTDYIFSVIGEEFGALASVLLLLLFGGFVIRGLGFLTKERDPFVLLAVSGLLMQFGFQVLINIGVNLGLLPPKGMTLPFISYGGSSMVALALGMGVVLALTRCNRNERSLGQGNSVRIRKRGL